MCIYVAQWLKKKKRLEQLGRSLHSSTYLLVTWISTVINVSPGSSAGGWGLLSNIEILLCLIIFGFVTSKAVN